MKRLSFATRRVLSGIALAQLLFFAMNFYRFHLFGEYDRRALVVSAVLTGICVLFVGPSLEEQWEYRRKGRSFRR